MKRKMIVGLLLVLVTFTTTGCAEWITDWVNPQGNSLKEVVDKSASETEKFKKEREKLPQVEITKADDLLSFTKMVSIVDLNHIKMSNGTQEATFALAGIKVPEKADSEKVHTAINRILEKAVDVVIESTSKKAITKDSKGNVYAYIRADGVLVNEILVRDGLLDVDQTLISGDDVNFSILLKALTNAKENNLGVWFDPAAVPSATPTPSGSAVPTEPATPSGSAAPTEPATPTTSPDPFAPPGSTTPDTNVPPVSTEPGKGTTGTTSGPKVEIALDSQITIKFVGVSSQINIISTKTADLDIGGWVIQDSTAKSAFVIPEKTMLKAKGTYSVRVGKPDPKIQLLTWDHTIDNAYTRLELYNAKTKLVTSVN